MCTLVELQKYNQKEFVEQEVKIIEMTNVLDDKDVLRNISLYGEEPIPRKFIESLKPDEEGEYIIFSCAKNNRV